MPISTIKSFLKNVYWESRINTVPYIFCVSLCCSSFLQMKFVCIQMASALLISHHAAMYLFHLRTVMLGVSGVKNKNIFHRCIFRFFKEGNRLYGLVAANQIFQEFNSRHQPFKIKVLEHASGLDLMRKLSYMLNKYPFGNKRVKTM